MSDCDICNAPLSGSRVRYCSPSCAQKGHRARARESRKADPRQCTHCSQLLVGKQLKYCSKECRDLDYLTAARKARPDLGLTCRRCDKALVGRQRAWCSNTCQRDFETEAALIEGIRVLTRKCSKCGLTKPLAVDFYTTPTGTHRRQCRACIMAGNATRNEQPDVRDKKRNHHLVGLYGITAEEYEVLLRAQFGACAVCGKPPISKRLAVDHDHRSGQIRGLLCNHCNLRVIGKLTNAEIFARASEYLANPPARLAIGERVVPTRPKKKRKTRRTTTPRKRAA